MMKKLYIALGFLFLWNAAAFAQISLDKRQISFEAQAGQTVTGSVTVINNQARDMTMRAYFEDIVFEPPYTGNLDFAPRGSTPYSLGGLADVSLPSFILPAKSRQNVTFSLTLPKDAKGGYYGVLLFEQEGTGAAAQTSISLVMRDGCRISVEPLDARRQARIDNVAAVGGVIEADVVNSGNVLLEGKASFYLMDSSGIVADRGDISEYMLPAGEKARVSIPAGEKVSSGGTYTVVIDIEMKKGGALVKEVDIIRDPSGALAVAAVRD